jgi:hypothetical protein
MCIFLNVLPASRRQINNWGQFEIADAPAGKMPAAR